MNKTPNYQLSQWELTDPVRMDDFNADNAKIDGELTLLREHLFSLAYYAGLLALRHQTQGNPITPQFPILTCSFHPNENITHEGDVSISNNLATLSGANAAGSILIRRSSFVSFHLKGKAARLWVHTSGTGTVTPYLNGVEMPKRKDFPVASPSISNGWCYVYALDTPYTEDVNLKLEMKCTSGSLKVGDIIMAQL